MACTGTYCPALSSASTTTEHAKACPAGYHMDVTQNAHNQFNCHPNTPDQVDTVDATTGLVTASSECTLGYYCPEGVKNAAS